MKIYLIIFSRTIAIVGLVYIGLCAWLYFKQESLLFFPNTLEKDYIFNFNAALEEVFIETPDGETVHAIHFKSEAKRGILLSFHGNGEALDRAGYEAERFVELGYDVLMPDYRSYGKSTGTLSEANLFNDAKLFYDYLIDQGFDSSEIILYGRSIGTGVASYLASEVPHKKLILFTPYYSMYHLAHENYPYVPLSLLLRYPLRTDQYVKNLKTPIYIFHGTEDAIIPYSHAKRLAKLTHSEDTFFTIEGGNHNNLMEFDAFWDAMEIALDVNVRSESNVSGR